MAELSWENFAWLVRFATTPNAQLMGREPGTRSEMMSSVRESNSMGMSEVQVAGTLKADGTVQLDQKPLLAPGRVTVVLRHEVQQGRKAGRWAMRSSD
jgi:hypothetical protein